LKPEDWEIINGQILPSAWYPYENGRRIGFAVFKEIAQSNLETVRSFGRFSGKNFLEVYANVLVKGDPGASVEKLSVLNRTFSDGGSEISVIEKTPNSLTYKLIFPPEEKEDKFMEAYCFKLMGTIEEIVAQAGGNNIKTTHKRTEEGYEIFLKWE